MNLKTNLEYWHISLQNQEPVIDEYYINDEIIIEDEEFVKKVKRLRELITSYCVIIEKNEKVSTEILDEIYEIIASIDKIQYTEFVAFWKVLDMSFSVFKQLPNQKIILSELLKKYCLHRRELYDECGYSNVIMQALHDSGTSRKKGESGIIKILNLAEEILGPIKHLEKIKYFDKDEFKLGYFLPDKGDEKIFDSFCEKFKVNYEFGINHQGKRPDIVFKIEDHFFIIEAKHIKESGGAQDKQIVELIEFIKHSEHSKNIHYISFMDGVYFNNFISISFQKSYNQNKNQKLHKQKKDIEKHLCNNKNNFFVNTFGLKSIFEDIKNSI